MRLPRLRVRTYVLAVSLVALFLWGTLMAGWTYHYSERARIYGAWERDWREIAKRDLDRGATRTIGARWGLQIADYYASLVRKYQRAKWRPWRRVDPDPPPPSEVPHRPPYLLEFRRRPGRLAASGRFLQGPSAGFDGRGDSI